MRQGERIALRFGVVFGALAIAPFPLDLVPHLGRMIGAYVDHGWAWLVDVLARNVLGTGPIVVVPTGSTDTIFGYLRLALIAILAVLGTIAWSLVDRRRRTDDARVAEVAHVVLRYMLAVTMWAYGLSKVFVLQFPAVSLTALYQPVGHKSPMGMLWTFMGSSPAYSVFGGVLECAGAMLLCWRRTTTLGALVLAGVLANVVMLNFCYDVPVKLGSLQLFVTAIVLLLPDARRLVAFVLGHPVPRPDPPALNARSKRARIASVVGKTILIGWIGYHQIAADLAVCDMFASLHQPLEGSWNVARYECGPTDAAATRWTLLVISRSGGVLVRTGDGVMAKSAVASHDAKRLELQDMAAFDVDRTGEDHVRLVGTIKDRPAIVELVRADDSEMELVHRGFHWIQPFSYDR